MENPEKSLLHLTQIEEKAQEILSDREEIVALDKQRNHNREAIRAVQKQDHTTAWITVGPLLVKMPIKKVSNILNNGRNYMRLVVSLVSCHVKSFHNFSPIFFQIKFAWM